MATQQLLVPEEQRRMLSSLVGQTIGGVASMATHFRESWEASYEFYIEVGDRVIQLEATWAASDDDALAGELASFEATAGVASDFRRLSTWYHWWKGETIEDVLLVTDEVTVERADEESSHLVHDIGVVLVCDVHAIAVCLDQNLEFPNLVVGHELVEAGRPGIHTHPGVNSLCWLSAERVTHARSVASLSSQGATP